MLVRLPFVLLLLDVWPLRRPPADQPQEARTRIRRLVWEKLPLFILSLACGAVTYWAQATGRAVSSLKPTPWTFRVGNSVMSYVRSIGKTFRPVNLAVFYPYPGAPALSKVVVSRWLSLGRQNVGSWSTCPLGI